MDLKRFVDKGSLPVPLGLLGADQELVNDIQGHLMLFGLLDPPVDGKFGPVSKWALSTFCQRASISLNDGFNTTVASALNEATVEDDYPLLPQADFAGRVILAMIKQRYWIARHPDCRNIVYIEGCNPDGSANDNKPNRFNVRDHRVVSVAASALSAWCLSLHAHFPLDLVS